MDKRIGLVEGFYGRGWQSSDRLALLTNLSAAGFGRYIYAPKNDAKLRAAWREPWSDREFEEVFALAEHCRAHHIAFGVGLSPLGLTDISDAAERASMCTKLGQIDSLSPDLLGVFFDDMPNNRAALAIHQIRTLDFIAAASAATQLLMCPSYYSNDEVLQKYFGAMPARYWKDLGKGLDASVELFWTGEKVCSEQYSKSNLDFIASEFRREPTLWDNYPVNDGARMCRYLHLKPFAGREAWLEKYTAGHFANPMSQSHLSALPLATLPLVYAGYNKDEIHVKWQEIALELWGDCGESIVRDVDLFQDEGLDGISDTRNTELQAQYAGYNVACSQEIIEWLAGSYAFDPNCLTDA